MTASKTSELRLSLRIDLPGGARFGPGMAALLAAIGETGSIRGAAGQLGMSYPKALKLVEAMNAAFEGGVVEARHGGAARGGASLTATGKQLLALHDRLVSDTDAASRATLGEISGMLANPTP